MPVINLPFTTTAAQEPAFTHSAERKCLGGARAGGKSASIGGKAANNAVLNPGCEYVLMRADLADLKKSTLLELEKFLPKGQYKHHKTDHYYEVQTTVPGFPSRIWYVEGKDPGSIKSSNLSGLYVDEGDEVPFATWMNATGSIRGAYPREIWDKVNPVTGHEFGEFPAHEAAVATNPAPCWIADIFPVMEDEQPLWWSEYRKDRFFDPVRSPNKDYQDKLLDSNYLYVPFLAKDNPYNPEGYWEQLIEDYKHDPVLLARNVYGRWDISMQGLVYQLQREHRWYTDQVGKRLWVPNEPVVLGIDPSNGAGTYACVAVQFINGRIFQIDEWGRDGGIDEDLANWLQAQPWKNDIKDVIVDSAKPDSITRLRLLGLPARKCRGKDVDAQVNAVKAAMFIDPGKGYAAYLMDEARCPRTREEFGKRSYRKPSDRVDGLRVPEQPVKAFDHYLNALEYVVFDKMPVPNRTGGLYREAVRQVNGVFKGRSRTTDANYKYHEDLNTTDGPRYNHLYRPPAPRR
jgi:hypothetical protein